MVVPRPVLRAASQEPEDRRMEAQLVPRDVGAAEPRPGRRPAARPSQLGPDRHAARLRPAHDRELMAVAKFARQVTSQGDSGGFHHAEQLPAAPGKLSARAGHHVYRLALGGGSYLVDRPGVEMAVGERSHPLEGSGWNLAVRSLSSLIHRHAQTYTSSLDTSVTSGVGSPREAVVSTPWGRPGWASATPNVSLPRRAM